MSENIEDKIEKEIEKFAQNVGILAARLKLHPTQVLALLSHRELLIINQQLMQIHEMFDLLYKEMKK